MVRAGPITLDQISAPYLDASRRRRRAANEAVYNHQAAATWRGTIMDKCAQDLLRYQEIITTRLPDIIVETGTWFGGSARFFADLCEMVGRGRVLSIDIGSQGGLPEHDRITYLRGDSKDPHTVALAREWADGETGMVILDSDHSKGHVLAELDAYADLVDVGDFLVVEDTNINGNPVRPDFGPGPYEAVMDWLPRNGRFAIDAGEPYITFAPDGYLRRIS